MRPKKHAGIIFAWSNLLSCIQFIQQNTNDGQSCARRRANNVLKAFPKDNPLDFMLACQEDKEMSITEQNHRGLSTHLRIFFSLSPVRVRVYDPEKDSGKPTTLADFKNTWGFGKTEHKIFQKYL